MKKYFLAAAFIAITTNYGQADAAQISLTGPYCREYTQTFIVGGRKEKGYGTACMQPDGSWEIARPAQVERQTASIEDVVIDSPPVYVDNPRPYPMVSRMRIFYGPRYVRSWNHQRYEHDWHNHHHDFRR